jgi:hypothetical protein
MGWPTRNQAAFAACSTSLRRPSCRCSRWLPEVDPLPCTDRPEFVLQASAVELMGSERREYRTAQLNALGDSGVHGRFADLVRGVGHRVFLPLNEQHPDAGGDPVQMECQSQSGNTAAGDHSVIVIGCGGAETEPPAELLLE